MSRWVRRSVRRPGSQQMERRDVKRLIHLIKNNDLSIKVLRLKNFLLADTNQEVIEAVLDALYDNAVVEVLYIQNFIHRIYYKDIAMLDPQLEKLAKVLRRGRIWAVNVGENFSISNKAWAKFAEELQFTNITHMYANSETTLPPEIKLRMRNVIRNNRKTDRRHRSLQHYDVIKEIGQMWWNPRLPICRALARNSKVACWSCYSNIACDTIMHCSGYGCQAQYHLDCLEKDKILRFQSMKNEDKTSNSNDKINVLTSKPAAESTLLMSKKDNKWFCSFCLDNKISKKRGRISTISQESRNSYKSKNARNERNNDKFLSILVKRCSTLGRRIIVRMTDNEEINTINSSRNSQKSIIKKSDKTEKSFIGKCQFRKKTVNVSLKNSKKTNHQNSFQNNNHSYVNNWRIGHIIRQKGRCGPVLVHFPVQNKKANKKSKKSCIEEKWIYLDGRDSFSYCIGTELVWAKLSFKNGYHTLSNVDDIETTDHIWWPGEVFSFSEDCCAEVKKERNGEKFIVLFGKNDNFDKNNQWKTSMLSCIPNISSCILPMHSTCTTMKNQSNNLEIEIINEHIYCKNNENNKAWIAAVNQAKHELGVQYKLQQNQIAAEKLRQAGEIAKSSTPNKVYHSTSRSTENGPPSPGHAKKRRIQNDEMVARALAFADRSLQERQIATLASTKASLKKQK